MGCDFPLKAFRSASLRGPSGKPLLTFNPMDAMQSTGAINIPCHNCMGCKLEHARQWAVRMTHESKSWDQNCFLTLTYSNEHVPTSYGLDLRDLQLFFKRLRRKLGDRRIRFYACGEYGDENGRPHYHAIVFNFDPPDKKPWAKPRDHVLYTSQFMDEVWEKGWVGVGDVTPQSCSYTARYVTKKIHTGDDYGQGRYFRISPIDGRWHKVRPEFSVMSRKPGIGAAYVKEFKSDFFPSGFIVVDGQPQGVPRYYLDQLSEEERKQLRNQTLRRGVQPRAERSMERKRARAAVRDARITNLKREI